MKTNKRLRKIFRPMLNLKAFSATFDSVSSRVLSLESLFVCFQKKIIKNKKLEAELPDWQVSGQLNSNYCGNLLHNPAVIFAQCSLSLSVSVSGRNLGIQPREKLIQAFNTTGSKTMNHNGIFPKLTSFLSKKKKKYHKLQLFYQQISAEIFNSMAIGAIFFLLFCSGSDIFTAFFYVVQFGDLRNYLLVFLTIHIHIV